MCFPAFALVRLRSDLRSVCVMGGAVGFTRPSSCAATVELPQTATYSHRQTQTDAERHRPTQTDTDRQTNTDRQRQTQTDTDRHHRQTQTVTDMQHHSEFRAPVRDFVLLPSPPKPRWVGASIVPVLGVALAGPGLQSLAQTHVFERARPTESDPSWKGRCPWSGPAVF